MTNGEQLFLLLVLATFGGFGLWLGYNSVRFDRFRAGRPEARRLEAAPQDMAPNMAPNMAHAAAD